MNAFIFMPIWCGFVYLFSKYVNVSTIETIENQKIQRFNKGFVIFAFLPIFWLAAIGEPCADTIGILKQYNAIAPNLSSINISNNGWGFDLFTVIIKKIFNNEIIYRIIIALVHSLPIVFIFRKYSDDYIMSFFLFVTTATYLSWMMNGLRQFMAVTIILSSIPFLIKKKYIKVCLLVLLATAIHQTAIIMLPILFIVRGKIFNKYTMFFIVLSVIAMALFSLNSNLFEATIGTTQYADGYDIVKEADDGINPIRVLVNAIPVVLAFLSKEKLKAEDNMFNNIAINLSMITLGVSLIAMVTSGIYVGRVMIYTQLFSFIILPKLISITFDKKSKIFVYMAMILLYLVYYKRELGNYYYYDFDIFGALR